MPFLRLEPYAGTGLMLRELDVCSGDLGIPDEKARCEDRRAIVYTALSTPLPARMKQMGLAMMMPLFSPSLRRPIVCSTKKSQTAMQAGQR